MAYEQEYDSIQHYARTAASLLGSLVKWRIFTIQPRQHVICCRLLGELGMLRRYDVGEVQEKRVRDVVSLKETSTSISWNQGHFNALDTRPAFA